jgi:hypothetical protein
MDVHHDRPPVPAPGAFWCAPGCGIVVIMWASAAVSRGSAALDHGSGRAAPPIVMAPGGSGDRRLSRSAFTTIGGRCSRAALDEALRAPAPVGARPAAGSW